MESLHLTIADFCRAYRIARSSAYRELAAGRLAALKRGARTVIARVEAERWAASLPDYRPHAGVASNDRTAP